jgi:hypothetical protein
MSSRTAVLLTLFGPKPYTGTRTHEYEDSGDDLKKVVEPPVADEKVIEPPAADASDKSAE